MFNNLQGPTNVIADPFSKLVNTNNDLANKLAALRVVPEEILSLIRHDLNFMNQNGPELQRKEEDEYEESLYDIKQNQFYPKSVREFQISPQMRELIGAVHNSIVGHLGVERTFEKLVAQGHAWKYMREHVKYFIRNCCPLCQKMSQLRTPYTD